MQYTMLADTGVEVSRICFGTMSFGGDADRETSAGMYRRCRDAGINFFDCADVYPGADAAGVSEEILGSLIRSERDQLVISTKVYGKVGPDRNDQRLSRRHMMRAVEHSLQRLGTDRVELYFLHNFDDLTPIEESLRAMEDLVRAGKILYPAVSNWAAWQIASAIGAAEMHNWRRLACVQPMYSLAKRQAEVEILPLARARNLAVISYSPVGGGLLSGKYGRKARPGQGRLLDNAMYKKRYGEGSYYELAERFSQHCAGRAVHPVTVAVAWVMANDAVTAPIVGARNLQQLEPALAAAELEMDPDWYAEVSALSPAPPPAHDRSETSE